MVVRLKLEIEQAEYSALLKLALSELRNPEDQLHHILREELIRCGLISPADNNSTYQKATALPDAPEEVPYD